MKKLKNNSGATILMALLLILLAMAVGAAILTAAVSAAHHMKSDREAQQNYLTVSSAAERASIVFAMPLPPRMSTVLISGLIRAQRMARFASSIPTTAGNGSALRGSPGISPAPLCPDRHPRTGAS